MTQEERKWKLNTEIRRNTLGKEVLGTSLLTKHVFPTLRTGDLYINF